MNVDPRLVKRWEVTRTLLSEAAVEVESQAGFAQYLHFIEHNELQLALDELIALGDDTRVSPNFWWTLKKAAEVMGLASYYALLRDKRRIAAGVDNSR